MHTRREMLKVAELGAAAVGLPFLAQAQAVTNVSEREANMASGRGPNGCHFADWALKTPGTPCIRAKDGGLTVMASDFMAAGKNQIEIDAAVRSAIVVGNCLRGGAKIANKSEGAQIGFNASA